MNSRRPEHRFMLPRSARIALLGAGLLPLAACSGSGFGLDTLNPFAGEKYETKVEPNTAPDELYNQGLVRLKNGNAAGAAKKFSALEKRFPSSDWQKKGLIMATFANYRDKRYDDAIDTGKRYVATYPSESDAPYAQYLIGMANFDQIPEISRDQDKANKAYEAFTTLVEKYPKSEYVADAKLKLQVVRDQLAGKEMSIGRHYLADRNFTGAINRFHTVLGKFPNTRHSEEALERLTEAYMGLGVTSEAQTAAAILGHNYPDSPWYKDAFELLRSGGLSPQEDKGSWISKLYRKIGFS